MNISRISFDEYLALSGGDATGDCADAGHSWYVSSDQCLIGRVVLDPVSHLWEPIVSVAIAGGWIDVHVEPDEFTTLRSAELSLTGHMSEMGWSAYSCHDAEASSGHRSA